MSDNAADHDIMMDHGHRPPVTIPAAADLDFALGAEADAVRPGPESAVGRSTSRDSDTAPAAVSELQLTRAAHRARLELEPGVIYTVCVDHAFAVLNSLMAIAQ